MKKCVEILSALLFIVVMCSAASAALPSVIMLSSRNNPNETCAKMEKVLSEINSRYAGKISTSKVYLDNNKDLAKKYNVRYVPTLIFRNSAGKDIAQEVGYKSLDDVLQIFARAGIRI